MPRTAVESDLDYLNKELWKGARPSRKLDWQHGSDERLDTYARDIDARVQFLQARIRGFLRRLKADGRNVLPLPDDDMGKSGGLRDETNCVSDRASAGKERDTMYGQMKRLKGRNIDKRSEECSIDEASNLSAEGSAERGDHNVLTEREGSSENGDSSGGEDGSVESGGLLASSDETGSDEELGREPFNPPPYIAPAPFQEVDFTKKQVDDLPPGWSLCWDACDELFYADCTQDIQTKVHPYQSDATSGYGDWFDVTASWIAHRSRKAPSLELCNLGDPAPTIEVLALESQAKSSGSTMRWWNEHPNAIQSDGLCAVCCHINFNFLMTWNCFSVQWKKFYLAPLHAIIRMTNCSLCRLVAYCANMKLDPSDMAKVRSSSVAVRCALYPTLMDTLTPLSIEFNKFESFDSEATHARIYQILPEHEGIPMNKWSATQSLRHGMPVEDQIDTRLVNLWLSKTDHIYTTYRSHSLVDAHNRAMEPELTVIDVWQERLTTATPDSRYIALSYIWGGSQSQMNTLQTVQKLHEPHSLAIDGSLPRTIRDAMQLVRLVGERYLWVDSLCITQDDDIMMATQIVNMFNIYRGAFFTIVGAYGDSCHAGLPGLRPGSRSGQLRVRVQDVTLANGLFTYEAAVQGSRWNTRGWTYQESELCSRYVLFTEHQMYFRCCGSIQKEESGLTQVSPNTVYNLRTQERPNFLTYWDAVKHYSRRNLSDEREGVNAFLGIERLLQPMFKSDFIFGLPETELDLALLWRSSTSKLRRRVGFPSWSWAGWIGPNSVAGFSDPRVLTSDQFRTDLKKPFNSNTKEEWKNDRRRERFIYDIPFWYRESDRLIECLHPTEAQDQRIVRSFLGIGSHELRFKALVASFRLEAHTSNDGRKIAILDRDDFVAGEVWLDNPAQSFGDMKSFGGIGSFGDIGSSMVIPSPDDISLSHDVDSSSDVNISIDSPNNASLATASNSSRRAAELEAVEMIFLSRRRASEWDCSCTYDDEHPDDDPGFFDDFNIVSDRGTIYPGQQSLEQVDDYFDHRRYNVHQPFPLYNVMMIDRTNHEDGVAERAGVGIVHVTAFWQANPEWKHIVLG